MTQKSFTRCAIVLAQTLLLCACSGLLSSDQPAARTWWLEPLQANTAGTGGPALRLHLGVVPGLDSDEILTLSPDARLSRFQGAYWAGHLPELLESLLARSLQSSGRFAAVTPTGQAGPGECRLDLEARRFYAVLDAADSARSVDVELAGQLACDGSSKPIRATASVPVSGNHLPSVVAAFQNALDEATRELLGQL